MKASRMQSVYMIIHQPQVFGLFHPLNRTINRKEVGAGNCLFRRERLLIAASVIPAECRRTIYGMPPQPFSGEEEDKVMEDRSRHLLEFPAGYNDSLSSQTI
ncbi:hypothetical protein AVEN_140075-1 [Araneus ventricosus]|uniref:Uncharacterized protein n=1 Tax=Araneus ventricosus TaxID=182803 RepID=A0A4Y2WQV8_ARAVE|nr:hypothetical protein AVEN_244908-1 [Araneus ventricosus]GBO39559.1 hypothetical protein AVEN_268708-1 [Araneus ventricosus]GBO39561.1 hypothetical protein AVEN_24521-1 [Araneus ventricosus]GBO39564.1 hypothetical protein AVEN_140075-1 [Araneus ventricosus]